MHRIPLAWIFLNIAFRTAFSAPIDDDGRTPAKNVAGFVYEESLKIGNNQDPHYSFFKIRGIAVDRSGNLYILEMGNARIMKYDGKGRFIGQIGRMGQGPGEFQQPTIIRYDEVYAYDLVEDTGDEYVIKHRIANWDSLPR